MKKLKFKFAIAVIVTIALCLTFDSKVDAQKKDQKGLAVATVAVPIGTILPFAGVYSNGDLGGVWLVCDGSSLRKTDYPALEKIIGTSWGEGDNKPTTFNLPDLRGVFLRGVSNGNNDDPDKDKRTERKPGGNTGDRVGSFQSDQFQDHLHAATIADNTGIHGHPIEITKTNISGTNGTRDGDTDNEKWNSDPSLGSITAKTGDNSGGHSHLVTVSDPTSGRHGVETRPKNVGVYYIIRVK
jgi:microcystin-dependent protein